MSFGAAATGLLVFLLGLRRRIAQNGRRLTYQFLPRKVHYVQLLMHSSIYAYWGWYWREVYHYIPLILAQLVFAYALDMLVCWFQQACDLDLAAACKQVMVSPATALAPQP